MTIKKLIDHIETATLVAVGSLPVQWILAIWLDWRWLLTSIVTMLLVAASTWARRELKKDFPEQ